MAGLDAAWVGPAWLVMAGQGRDRMTGESTTMHGPASDAPAVTEKICICQVCGVQWAKRSDAPEGCAFCGAPSSSVSVISEHPTYGGTLLT